MSIANELSSEVAAAVLSRQDNEDSGERRDLRDMLIEVHSTLRHMTVETRKASRLAKNSKTPRGNAISGGN